VTNYSLILFAEAAPAGSPTSPTAHAIRYVPSREHAEQILTILVDILTIPAYYTTFSSTLPLTRICLLLLGDKPTPFVAEKTLTIIAISMEQSPSFARKFELISGWNVLKTVLPGAWDIKVKERAFDVLLGRVNHDGEEQQEVNGNGNVKVKAEKEKKEENVVVCPGIAPAILASLRAGLGVVASTAEEEDEVEGMLVLPVHR
jgi:hypothetical protein